MKNQLEKCSRKTAPKMTRKQHTLQPTITDPMPHPAPGRRCVNAPGPAEAENQYHRQRSGGDVAHKPRRMLGARRGPEANAAWVQGHDKRPVVLGIRAIGGHNERQESVLMGLVAHFDVMFVGANRRPASPCQACMWDQCCAPLWWHAL